MVRLFEAFIPLFLIASLVFWLRRKSPTPSLLDAIQNDVLLEDRWLSEEILRRQPVDINAVDEEGNTALILAVKHATPGVIKKLLKYPHIDVNQANHRGWTPLMRAAQWDNHSAMRLLAQDKRVRLNQRDKSGWTALMYAAACSPKGMRILLARKAR